MASAQISEVSYGRAALYSFLTQHRYAIVSSLSATGTPQSALVGIAITPEPEIIFDTVKTSRKYPNLIARPDCSLVVGGAGKQTVQFEGLAAEPKVIRLKALPIGLLCGLA